MHITRKQWGDILKTLDAHADKDGIADIRKVASATCHKQEEINDVVRRVGFMRLDMWRVNVKVVNL